MIARKCPTKSQRGNKRPVVRIIRNCFNISTTYVIRVFAHKNVKLFLF